METISGTQGYWKVWLTVNEKSTSVENNDSSAYWELWIGRTYASTSYIQGTPNINIKISGKTAYDESPYLNISGITEKGVRLLSGTVSNIEHNSDGTIKSNAISFTWKGSGFNPNDVSASGTYSTATIPRASSIAVGNYNLGQNISITIGKKVSSFTSTLTYKIGNRIGTIVEKTKEPSCVWEMPEELISQIKQDNPSNAKPIAIIYCETYNGNTKIGDTKSATFNLYITDKPKLTALSLDESRWDIKEYTDNVLKYISVIGVSVAAEAPEGTTISNYKIKWGNIEKNTSDGIFYIDNIQYSYLDEKGNRKTKFTVIATDARGNSSDSYFSTEEYPYICDFIEYVQLNFNNTDIKLTRLNGTSNFIKLHMTGYVYNGLFGETQNTLNIKYRYKLKNDSTAEWSELKTLTPTLNEDNTFIIEDFQLEDEFDYRENYDIEFYAEDLFSETSYSTVIKTSETIAKWHKNGAYIKEIDTKQLKIDGIKIKKEVIFEGKLYGNEDITLKDVKRYLDVYFRIDFGDYDGVGKYTIDTTLDHPTYGSGIIHCFDTNTGLEYYISECSYDKGVLTHTNTGFFKISDKTYNDRSNAYFIYRVETYD